MGAEVLTGFLNGGDFMHYEKPSKKNPIKHLIYNIRDSHNGLKIMFRESSTFHRIYPMMLAGGIVLGLAFRFIALEYIILGAIFILDVEAETMNSAVEEVCDRVNKSPDPLIKRAKDIASAAVYIMHLSYIGTAVFFAISHATGFDWWTKIIPA